MDPSKQWPNSAVPRTFGHVDGYISWELARVTITQHTVLFERAGGRTACLSVGSRMPWLSCHPQVSTKVRGYDKSIHKSNHTPISSTTSTGAGDFQAHFPSSFSGAGTGAAFWLLAGPPSVFRVQVWIEEPAAYNYKWPLNIPNSIGFSCFHRQVIQDTTAKIMSKRVADQEAEGCHSKC